MKHKIVHPRCGALLIVASALGSSLDAQSVARSLQVGGVARTYVLHVPARAPAASGYPLVLTLHGAGGTGRRIAAHTGMDRIADREGFIAVYPDGLDRRWNDGRGRSASDDVAFIRSLLDTLRRQYRIDSTRIFATGISNGAMLAHRLACDLPGLFAAIAPVAGAMPVHVAEGCQGATVSMIAMQGTADRLVPYDGGNVGSARGAVLSAPATAAHWARAAGCRAIPAAEALPDRVRDGTRVQRLTWPGCDRGIALYAVVGGGHTWPGGPAGSSRLIGRTTREIDGAEVIWEFFRTHPKR